MKRNFIYTTALSLALFCNLLFCVSTDNVAQALEDPVLDSKACCLLDSATGQVLLEKNSLQHLPIASVTKTMTLLLTFEAIEQKKFGIDDLLVASENASGMGGSQVFLDANCKYKVQDLLYAVVMSSANDASVVFAEEIGGSEDGFVDMMNEKAQSLGLTNTHFANCTGLPNNQHYSCAYDVACIMRELVKHKMYFDYTHERLKDFVHPSGRTTQMTNTNKLIRSYNGCDAGKTGSTVEAGYCLSATAMRNNMRLISVVLGAKNSKERFSDCAKVLDYGFANYESKCIVDENEEFLYSNQILHAKEQQVYVKPAHSYYELIKRGEQPSVEVNYEYYDKKAPLKAGDSIGQIIITKDNTVQQQIDIVLTNDIENKSYLDEIKYITQNW